MRMATTSISLTESSGYLETYEAVRYQKGLFTNVATSAEYSNPANTTRNLLQPLIFQAVARVVIKHPILSAVFLGADTAKPRYAQLPRIDLRECIVFVEQDPGFKGSDTTRNPGWDRLLEEYHNMRFDDRWGQLPLWRLVISYPPSSNTEFIACFVHLHGICDGNSGPAFHRAFLAELQTLSQQGLSDTFDHIVRSPNAPPLPSIEALHRLPLSPDYLLKLAWQDTFPKKNKHVWLGAPASTRPTRSRFLSITLPADTTRKLVAVSRSHGTSLTGTIHALVGTALFANLPKDATTALKSGLAINLRRFLSQELVDQDSFGNWVYVAYDAMKRPSSTSKISWEYAQHVKKLLDDEVRRAGKNTPMGCLRYVGNMHKFFEKRCKGQREGSYLLSNLGAFKPRDNNDARPWKTGRMIFSEGFDASGEPIDVMMITGCDGCLTVGFVWSDSIVQENFILKVSGTLEKLMVDTAHDTEV